MIYTWAADITPLLNEECYRKYFSEAPEFRREKADRLKHMRGKAQSIGVWALYAQMKDYFGLDGQEIYNFSHSGDYVLCSVCIKGGVSGGRILLGCDVEKVGKTQIKMAKRFFCESEYRCIEKEAGEKQREIFTRFWVLKESFMKAVRKGMKLPLDSFEIRLGNPSRLVRQPEEFPEVFYYMEYELGDGAYRAAVCSTDKEAGAEVWIIQLGL